ncbi:MAG: hypothetical protein JWR16_2844 [Nevskia sp.]|nr:hypothetical protein [Nevskia sp.]
MNELLRACALVGAMLASTALLAAGDAPPKDSVRANQLAFIRQLRLAVEACTAGYADDSVTKSWEEPTGSTEWRDPDCVASEKRDLIPKAKVFIESFPIADDQQHARGLFAQWRAAMDAIGGKLGPGEVARFETLSDVMLIDMGATTAGAP